MAIDSGALDPFGGSVYVSTDDQVLDPFGGSVDLITNSDVTAPTLTDEDAAEGSDGPTHITVQIDTDEDNGDIFVHFSSNTTELAGTVESSPVATLEVTATGTQIIANISGWVPGSGDYVHIVHKDDAGNYSDVESIQISNSHYSVTSVYSGNTILDTSYLYITDGSHTGSNSTTQLEDSTASWTVEGLSG